jgi:hypothetical protein
VRISLSLLTRSGKLKSVYFIHGSLKMGTIGTWDGKARPSTRSLIKTHLKPKFNPAMRFMAYRIPKRREPYLMEWLPDVCTQSHGEMVKIYWMMILPMIVLLIVLEMFKTQDKTPDAGKILTRAVASVLMLISFNETINLICFIGNGITDRIDGLAKMAKILKAFVVGLSYIKALRLI